MLKLEDVKRQAISKCLHKVLRLLIVLAVLACVKCVEVASENCVPMKMLYNVTLSGGIAAGDYMKIGTLHNHTKCSEYCCKNSECDLAFMADDMCYNLHCYSAKLCQTHSAKSSRFHVSVAYVKRGLSRDALTTILDRVSHDEGKENNSTTAILSGSRNSTLQKVGNHNNDNHNYNNKSLKDIEANTDNGKSQSSIVNANSSDNNQTNTGLTVNRTATSSVTNSSHPLTGDRTLVYNTRLSDYYLSGSGSGQNAIDRDDSAAQTEGSLSEYNDTTAERIGKMTVYWKNASHIVVKEVLDSASTTTDAPTTTRNFKPSSRAGEGTYSQSPFSTTLPATVSTQNDQITHSIESLSNFSLNTFSTNNSLSERTKGYFGINTHKSNVSATNASTLSKELHDNDMLDKSFSHLNSTRNNNTDSDLEDERHLQLVRGKSFQSKEKGTQFDLNNPLNPAKPYGNAQATVNGNSNHSAASTSQPAKITAVKTVNDNTKTSLDLNNPLIPTKTNGNAQVTANGNIRANSNRPVALTNQPDKITAAKPVQPSRELNGNIKNSFLETNSTSVTKLNIMQKQEEKRCFTQGVQPDVTLVYGLRAGNFSNFGKVHGIDECVRYCCSDKVCDLAMVLDDRCYTVHCWSQEYCRVKPAHPSAIHPQLSFIKRITLPSIASARDRDKSKLLPSVTPQKQVSKRIKGSRCKHGSIQNDVTLKSGPKAGVFKLRPKSKDMDSCLESCCKDISCNVAFLIDTSCYSVRCKSHEDCAIIKKGKTSKSTSSLSVVRSKIRPVNDKRQQIPKLANKFTTVLNITNKVFSAQLSDIESLEFLNMGVKIQTAISMLFTSYEEFQESEVISFQPSPLMTKVTLTLNDGARIKKMLVFLVKTIKSGKMQSSIDGVVETFELSTFGFQFNSPKGFNMVCDPEFDFDVHWKLTVFDYQSLSPCPRNAKGHVRRSCHGSEDHNATWGSPSFVGCQSSTFKTMEEKAKRFAEGAKKKIPFKNLQEELKTTPNEILIQVQKKTFEDTYRALLDMAHRKANKSLHDMKPSKKPSKPPTATKSLFSNSTFSIPLPDNKHLPTTTSAPSSKTAFTNGTFSIPLPEPKKQNQTLNSITFSRGEIPKTPKIKTQNVKQVNIVKPLKVIMNPKPLHAKPVQQLGQTRNQIPARKTIMSPINHPPKTQVGSMNSKVKAPIPASSSQTSVPGNARQSGLVPNRPLTPYQMYQQKLNNLKAAQAKQRLLQQQRQRQQKQQLQQQQQQQQQKQQQQQQQQQQFQQQNSMYPNNQASIRNQMWKNTQPYQQPWQSHPNWQANQVRQSGQTGFTGYGGVPGYGYAGFRDRPEKPQQREFSRKKRDLELLRVKRQGGNLVWYNNYKQNQPASGNQYNYPTSNDNTIDLRDPVLTDVKTGYDVPSATDSPDSDLSPFNENYFHSPTPYYQTATYRLGGNNPSTGNQKSGTDSTGQSPLDYESYPSSSISDIANTGKGLSSSSISDMSNTGKGLPTQAPLVELNPSQPPAGLGLTPLFPDKEPPTTPGSRTNSIQYIVTTSKPPLDQTTVRHQTPLQLPEPSVPVTTKSTSTNLPSTDTTHKATPTTTGTHSTVDALQKKLLDMTLKNKNHTTPKPVVEDFTKEKNRAPMFGGDIAAVVNILRSLSLYKKYTNPPETIDTLKQFLQVGSHILDKRNKHEWKYLTKESSDELSALDAAEIIEDYSNMVSKKLHPKDMSKPILTSNIMVVLKSMDMTTMNPSEDIQFPNNSDPAIRNWTDATDTLVIKPQSFINSVKGTKVQLVSCSVRRLTDLLPKSLVSKTFGNDTVISGHVMSVSSSPSLGDVIDPPIQIVLSNDNKDASQFEELCVFWERGPGNKAGKWSSQGCSFVESNLSHTICECTHMSTFSAVANTAKQKKIVAIATVPPQPPPEPEEQSNILYILLGVLAILMIIFVILAVICVLWKRRKKQHEGNSGLQRRDSARRRRTSGRSDDNISTGSEEFDDMMASRRRNIHPDAKKGPSDSPRWQRMRKNGENPENLMLKEKSYLLSDYHQPYHFLSAKTPQPPSTSSPSPSSSNRQRSRSS